MSGRGPGILYHNPMKNNIRPALAGKPFIKWVGGKGQLLSEIDRSLPDNFSSFDTYIEPFVGGGAVFFHMRQKYPDKRYVVNDYNTDLIEVYRTVRDTPQELINLLRELKREYTKLLSRAARKACFLRQREQYNNSTLDQTQRAALFIFLNKTCYGGLYRVNSTGRYNVPFGDCGKESFYDEITIMEDSRLLQSVTLKAGDYAKCGEYAAPGVFFYLDPPYRPLNLTSSFTAYTKAGFNDNAQIGLRNFCNMLTAKGARWMQSNSDGHRATPPNDFFDDLYRGRCISRVVALRNIHPGKKNNRVADYRLSALTN